MKLQTELRGSLDLFEINSYWIYMSLVPFKFQMYWIILISSQQNIREQSDCNFLFTETGCIIKTRPNIQ